MIDEAGTRKVQGKNDEENCPWGNEQQNKQDAATRGTSAQETTSRAKIQKNYNMQRPDEEVRQEYANREPDTLGKL